MGVSENRLSARQPKQTGSLAANAAFNVLYKVLNVVFPLISAVYLARILLPTGVGKISFAQNVASYMVLLAALGIPMYGVREIAKKRDSKEATDRLFSEILVINFCSTTLALVLYASVVVTLFPGEVALYMACGLPIVFNYISIDWLYQGKEEYVYIAIRSIAIKGLSIVAILLLVKSQDDYVISALISSLAICGNYVFNVMRARRYVTLTLHGLRLKQHLRPILVLVACSAGVQLYSNVDVLMLGATQSADVVGWYNNAQKVVGLVLTLATAISEIFLPRISYLYETDRKRFNELVSLGFRIVLFFSMPLTVGTMLVANDLVVVMFGEPFAPAALTMQLLSPLVLIKGLGDIVSYQVIISSDQESKLVVAYFSAALINVLLNSLLMPLFAQNGAAASSVITELVVNAVLLHYSRGIVDLTLDYRFMINVMLATVLMSAPMLFANMLVHSVIFGLMVDVMLAVATYLIFCLLTKNEIFLMILNSVRRKGNGAR